MNKSFLKAMVSVITVTLCGITLSAKSQESRYWQMGVFGGASTPIGDYHKQVGNAKKGFVTGLFSDYYFLNSNFGIGLDARFVHHSHEVPDTVFHSTSYIYNIYKSPKRYNHLGLTFGPQYKIQSANFGVELYAKAGIAFQQFPEYLRVTVVNGTQPVPIGSDNQVGQSGFVSSGIALTGLRANFRVAPKLFLSAYGDYQTTLSEQSFTKETPGKFQRQNSAYVQMINFGIGIKFLFGNIRDNDSLNRR